MASQRDGERVLLIILGSVSRTLSQSTEKITVDVPVVGREGVK